MNGSTDEIEGSVFGKWTVVKVLPRLYSHRMVWCKCECGNEKRVKLQSLRSGLSASCGCLRMALAKKRYTIHGRKNTPEHRAWQKARRRCANPKDDRFEHYGARGISMCTDWAMSFVQFFSDMGVCPPGLTLERKDVNLGYFPGNCIWATRKTQANNKRNNVRVVFAGKEMTLHECSEACSVDYHSLHHFYRVKGLELWQAVAMARKL